MPGIVTQIQRFSINDGPGIRTTIFLKGCTLNCKWCHNPECIVSHPEIYFRVARCRECGLCSKICPESAIDLKGTPRMRINRKACTLCMQCVKGCRFGALTQVGERLAEESVLNEVERDIPFYRNSGGGMTLSGGEPLSQLEFALSLLSGAKRRGINTALDTCGHQSFDKFEMLFDHLDLVLYDIKHMDSGKHKKGTGLGNELILENCKKLVKKGVRMRIRIPLIPGFNDSIDNMKATAKFINSLGLNDVDLLPYHTYAVPKYEMLGKEYELNATRLLADERVNTMRETFDREGLRTTVGG